MNPESGHRTTVEDPLDMRRRRLRIARLLSDGRRVDEDDHVVVEEPLEIRAAGPTQQPVTLVTTLRTPGQDDELAQPDDQVTVHLTGPVDVDAGARRHSTATASCGVCGRASIDELALRCSPVAAEAMTGHPVPWSLLTELPDRLREEQEVFGTTGGLHATGIFTAAGTLVTLREDVGRHNALDAAIGAHVLAGDLPMDRYLAVLSGRIGFELVAKAAAAGIPMVTAVGAPTDLAVRTARRFGITLVGFLRNGTCNVYTHSERVDEAA